MGNSASNVISGTPLASGGILVAPAGTKVPAGISDAPAAAFVVAGYIGEEGIVEGGERSTEKIKAWGGDTVKVVQTEHSLTYAFTFIETMNTSVLQSVYGPSNVSKKAATASTGTIHEVAITGDALPRQAYVFEVKDGNSRIRIVVPEGQITQVGEVTYSDSTLVGYAVTVECFPDAQGVKARKYLDNGIKAA